MPCIFNYVLCLHFRMGSIYPRRKMGIKVEIKADLEGRIIVATMG